MVFASRHWPVHLAVLAVWLGGCTSDPADKPSPDSSTLDTDETTDDSAEPPWGPVVVDPDAWPPELLSEMRLVRWTGTELEYNEGVLPYALNTPLFSDFAGKSRAIWMPPGAQAAWTEGASLEFPVGTVILKSFILPTDMTDPSGAVQLVETRLLIRGTEGWEGWPYLWRTDGSEADRHVSGKVFDHTFVDGRGQTRTAHYLVPQRNQCVDCHELFDEAGERVLQPIGPHGRFLDDGVQLEAMVADGRLTGAPDLADVVPAFDWARVEDVGVDGLDSTEVERAARDYLHMNCAHCHSPTGIEGVTSQFFLDYETTDAFHLGVCKRPGSAGEGGVDREFDVVPGDPAQSILWYRLSTENVGAMMPDIGRSLAHETGAELVWRWIAEMDPVDCE